jgi:hypothetical protein
VKSGFIARGQVQENASENVLLTNSAGLPLLLADVMYYQDLLRLGSLETKRPRGRLINKEGNLYRTKDGGSNE